MIMKIMSKMLKCSWKSLELFSFFSHYSYQSSWILKISSLFLGHFFKNFSSFLNIFNQICFSDFAGQVSCSQCQLTTHTHAHARCPKRKCWPLFGAGWRFRPGFPSQSVKWTLTHWLLVTDWATWTQSWILTPLVRDGPCQVADGPRAHQPPEELCLSVDVVWAFARHGAHGQVVVVVQQRPLVGEVVAKACQADLVTQQASQVECRHADSGHHLQERTGNTEINDYKLFSK